MANTTTTTEDQKEKSSFLTDFAHQITGEVVTPESSKITAGGLFTNVAHGGIGFLATFLPFKFGYKKQRGWKLTK